MIQLFKNNAKWHGHLIVNVIIMDVCEKVMTEVTMCVSIK